MATPVPGKTIPEVSPSEVVIANCITLGINTGNMGSIANGVHTLSVCISGLLNL